MKLLLGVTGSIAAYKAADIIRSFQKKGWEVQVVMSESATHFITPFTLSVLSKKPVLVDTFEEPRVDSIFHVESVKDVDAILIAPATAHTIGKIAQGLADNMLTNIVLVGHHLPRFYASAMNTSMYENPQVCLNRQMIEKMGWVHIEPKASLLACGDTGKGALADVDDIVESVLQGVAYETRD